MSIPVDRKPSLAIEGTALVLRDAYTATLPVRPGDAVKITGEWRVAPTEDPSDDVIGVAVNGANINQPVAVAVAGLVQTITTAALLRGDLLVPATALEGRGKSKPGSIMDPKLLDKSRKHGVAVETQGVAGKPVWAHLRVLGGGP